MPNDDLAWLQEKLECPERGPDGKVCRLRLLQCPMHIKQFLAELGCCAPVCLHLLSWQLALQHHRAAMMLCWRLGHARSTPRCRSAHADGMAWHKHAGSQPTISFFLLACSSTSC